MLAKKNEACASKKRKSTAMTQRIKTPSQIAIVFVIKIKSKKISARGEMVVRPRVPKD